MRAATEGPPCLLPAPRQLEVRRGTLPLARLPEWLCSDEWALASQALPGPESGAHVRLEPLPFSTHPEAYALTLDAAGVALAANTRAGVWLGAQTLLQLLRQARGGKLPCLAVRDWPDFPARGVMLDISRDKVPTLETLHALIGRLAGLKYNQLQLYTEHTFAYGAWPEVWAEASPLTAEEVRGLDAFCRERFIELVPNQNSFGHMERWLRHPRLTPLAETPAAVPAHYAATPLDLKSFSLCPLDPGAPELLRGLYAELLPHFTSRQFNVGCDETFELGQGRSRAACEARGKGRVYLDFLLQIHALVAAHGRTMQFWGDIILQHPELLPELPRDVIALEWGYEADHPFAEDTQRFAAAGLPFYVCPGSSSWHSLAGRTANMLANIERAARHGLAQGARGLLLTDWGDNGHWQYLPASHAAFAAAAAWAWHSPGPALADLARALDLHLFGAPECGLGRLWLEAGNLYQHLPEPANVNGTHLGRALLQAHLPLRPEMVFAPAQLQGLQVALGSLHAAANALPAQAGDPLAVDELRQTLALLAHAAELLRVRGGQGPGSQVAGLPTAERARLRAGLEPLLGEHRRLWLARNRPGGLRESLGRFERLRAQYR